MVAKFDSKTKKFIPFEFDGEEHFWSKKGYASIDSLVSVYVKSIDAGRTVAKVFVWILGILYVGGTRYAVYRL